MNRVLSFDKPAREAFMIKLVAKFLHLIQKMTALKQVAIQTFLMVVRMDQVIHDLLIKPMRCSLQDVV